MFDTYTWLEIKQTLKQAKSDRLKIQRRKNYAQADKISMVKKLAKQDKETYTENLTIKAEEVAKDPIQDSCRT